MSGQVDANTVDAAAAAAAGAPSAQAPSPARAPALQKPGGYDRALALGSAVLLACVVVAVVKGQAGWVRVPPMVWVHLGTVALALALTPVMLLRRRGDRRHRTLGYVWVAAMATTALSSLFVKLINPGGFSIIHVLSVWTLIQVPLIVVRARQHDWLRHRSAVRGMVLGALLIAGFFTFPFSRLLGSWLFG